MSAWQYLGALAQVFGDSGGRNRPGQFGLVGHDAPPAHTGAQQVGSGPSPPHLPVPWPRTGMRSSDNSVSVSLFRAPPQGPEPAPRLTENKCHNPLDRCPPALLSRLAGSVHCGHFTASGGGGQGQQRQPSALKTTPAHGRVRPSERRGCLARSTGCGPGAHTGARSSEQLVREGCPSISKHVKDSNPKPHASGNTGLLNSATKRTGSRQGYSGHSGRGRLPL